MEKQDIMDYVLKTPENTNPAILKSMLDQLEESSSGGGGDSDFGIANVTFINTSPTSNYNVQNVIYVVDEELDKGIYVGPNETITMPIVLYKGISRIAIIPINQEVAPTLTGSITYDNETRLFVCTGDGSITCEGTGSNQ